MAAMACFELKNVGFSYPGEQPILSELSFRVEEGEFLTVIGPSGGGKTTLLRLLKPELSPHGIGSGEILYCDTPLEELEKVRSAGEIGFVMQDPEEQLVTDRVWSELAFGLENLGLPTEVIRRRVAEMATFFGLEALFDREVKTLSGGQKQLVNLAAVMVMHPKVLILDEPAAQLDPIGAGEFLQTLGRLHRELGITVILSEHRLEEVLPLSDRVLVLDRERLFLGTPKEVGDALRSMGHSLFAAMPAGMQLCGSLTVPEAKQWLRSYQEERPLQLPERKERNKGDIVAELKRISFQYERDGAEVLHALSATFRRGEITAIFGGNGSGKSTTLSLLAGLRKPSSGTVRIEGRVGYLPQDPRLLFAEETLAQELGEDEEWIRLCGLESLLHRHPYDLSGGEQQRAALAIVLRSDPEILLLDEPTKGLDAANRGALGSLLTQLCQQGKTVILVSHDVEFCAAYAHSCMLLFRGEIVSEGTPYEFFAGNHFYTTAANRIAEGTEIITTNELLRACGMEPVELPAPRLSHRAESKPQSKPKEPHLPLWRVLLSGFGLLLAVLSGVHILTPLKFHFLAILPEGVRLGLLLAGLIVCLAAISQRAEPPLQRRKKNTGILLSVCLLIPATVLSGVYLLEGKYSLWIAVAVLLEILIPFFLHFEKRRPTARELVLPAMLSALAVAGRVAFYTVPNFKPVIAIVILSGVMLGGEGGFLVGALTMLLSNMLFGQGPWTPWQMTAMGLVGFLSGVLYRWGILRPRRGWLAVFGAVMSVVVYGVIMNLSSAFTWYTQPTWAHIAACCLSGLPFDLMQGGATAVYLWLFGKPMLKKLDRIRKKYGLL